MEDFPSFEEIQEKVQQRIIALWMSEGMTEAEAVARFQRVMDAPWPDHWPELPDFDDL